jgi:hypothetical protein
MSMEPRGSTGAHLCREVESKGAVMALEPYDNPRVCICGEVEPREVTRFRSHMAAWEPAYTRRL